LISNDEWHLFSSDIVNAGKISFTEGFAAWTTGVTTGTLSLPLIFVFGPVAGYYAGRAVHRKTVVKMVKERLDRDGDIRVSISFSIAQFYLTGVYVPISAQDIFKRGHSTQFC
jgi:hypothetical protein